VTKGRSPGPIQAFVLDMDGLMIDTEAIYKRVVQQACAELGAPLADAFYDTLVGLTNAASESAIEKHLGPSFPMAEFQRRWNALWKEQIATGGIPTKAGLDEILSFLAERGLPTAVATSSDHYYAGMSLKAAGLDGRFDHVVTVDQVRHGKPAPDLYLEATRRLGFAPARCVALEDSNVGVLAAGAAGLVTIMVPDLHPPTPAALAAAWTVVPTLHDARNRLETLL